MNRFGDIVRRWPLRPSGALVMLAALVATATLGQAAPIECWRGWGYRVDARSGTYASGELLLVTQGAPRWAPGLPVVLYELDRTSGRIRDDAEPMTVIPVAPRIYHRGRLDYVDGRGPLAGTDHDLVFGLSHIGPPSADLAPLAAYTAWACGRDGAPE